MAKRNIYIPDRLYGSMASEAERRGISFSHACSLAFMNWLNGLKRQEPTSDDSAKNQLAEKKDPSEIR
jgi:hypothetical protein